MALTTPLPIDTPDALGARFRPGLWAWRLDESLTKLRLTTTPRLSVWFGYGLDALWFASIAAVALLSAGGMYIAIVGSNPFNSASKGGYQLGNTLEFHQRSGDLGFLDGEWKSTSRGALLAGDSGSIEIPLAGDVPKGPLRLEMSIEMAFPRVGRGVYVDVLVDGRPAHRWKVHDEGWANLTTELELTRRQTHQPMMVTVVLSTNDAPPEQPVIDQAMTLARLRLSPAG